MKMRGPRVIDVVAAAMVLGVLACGQSPPPVDRPVPGGVLQGNYILRVQPSSECQAPARTFTIAVTARVANNDRGDGFQILPQGVEPPSPPASRLSGAAIVELELRYATPDVHGGLGTTSSGVAATEGFQLWSHAIATGTVMHVGSSPGEIDNGTLMGELEFGRTSDDEAGLGFCTSRTHHWSLKLS
jgi:hypothetical protein